MNAKEVAQDYLAGNLDWHHYSEAAQQNLVLLLEHVWKAGANAALTNPKEAGENKEQPPPMPVFNVDEADLDRIYDA